MTIDHEVDALSALDFPTPVAAYPDRASFDDGSSIPIAAEFRPLHSGLLVPTSDQDTWPVVRVQTTPARVDHSTPRETTLTHPAPSNGHRRPSAAPTAAAAPLPTAPPVQTPPKYVTPSGWQQLAAALAVRIAGERAESPAAAADRYVPGWTLVPLGAFTVAAAVAAFFLSFQMIVPVVVAAGWTTGAWLGPIVIDLAAVAAAFMGVASRHPAFVRTGRFLLVTATGLSISLNLAGHQVVAPAGHSAATPVLPPAWDWAVWLFSVTVPVILAVLIHVFGKALIAWTTQQKAIREAEQARAAEEARQAAERTAAAPVVAPAQPTPPAAAVAAELAAPPRATPAARRTSRPRHSKPGARERKEKALRIARAARATTPSAIRNALQAEGVPVPSQSTLENYAKELREELQPST